jgi:hypothetical protein
VPQWRSAILGDGSPLHIPRLDLASAPLELGFSAKEIRAGMPRKRKPRERKERSGRQCAALPLAVRDGEIMVMLVTSRETRRWVLPKGWAEPDLAPHELAAKSSCAWQRPRNDARQIALSSAPKTVADRGHAKPDRLARRALLLQGIRGTVVPVER